MKTFRTLLFLLALCAFPGLLLASDAQEYGNHSGNPFEIGYARGYQHGVQDVQSRQNFDFRHDAEYNNNRSGHLTYDTNQNCEVRVGYLEGYVDGYFRRQERFRVNMNYGYGDNRDGYSGMDDQVIAFTQRGYSGDSQQFRIGQYARLDGEMNDSIESMTVRGNVRVILFDKSNFGGQRVVLDRDFPDLGEFRGRAASMIVERATNR